MPNKIPKDAHAIIIGAMKCGTSSLYEYLSGHPKICPAITKEPEFFSENQGHGIQIDKYNDLFPYDDSTHKYTLDGSTGYTKYPSEPNVAKNIYDYGISPKFIYIIRNPFERIQSHFNFMQQNDRWNLRIIDEHLISTCNYFLQLEQYKKFFPLSDILLLDFDDLKNNPRALLSCIYDFLNLPHDYFPDIYEVKNQTRNSSNFEKKVKALKFDRFIRILPSAVQNSLRHILRKVAPSDKRVLTEGERELLFNQLKEGMRGLKDVYGFDTRKWGF